MGFLPRDYDDDNDDETPPSLVASDVIQQQYLGAAEYIGELCQSGALDPEAARPLTRCLLDWTIQQIRLMCRIEELELDLLTLDNMESKDATTNTQSQTQPTYHTGTSPTTHQKEYNTDKCKNKMKPIKFLSGGLINPRNTTSDTNTEHNTDIDNILEAHSTETSQTTDRQNEQLQQQENITIEETDMNKQSGATYDFDYKTLEENMRLSRLENVQTFQTALRLVTRLMHPKGAKVCYPIAEQTDRLMLKAQNIPTDGRELCDLLRKACSRRGESFNLETTYKDLAKAHGRVYFDWTLSGPDCMVYTHYP